ncbi:MAG: alpha/beta hydrolase [Ruminococcus sp.]|nr:alpha/beta hydrolase [Ruminococcus sp.]
MSDKSFLAGAADNVIKLYHSKRKFVGADACAAYISDMEKIGRQPYKLPAAAALSGRISERIEDGMQVFTIGREFSRQVLYLHGGSYFAPPNLFHWDMLTRISAAAEVCITAPIYPRAPVHTCSAAYSKLTKLCAESDFELFMGDSAGGGLALGLTQMLRDEGRHFPDELILISPWLDVTMSNAEMKQFEDTDPVLGIYGLKRFGKLWAGSLDIRDPRVSPIYGSFDGIKKLSIFIGTHEIFYPEVMRLERMLEGSETILDITVGEDMTHVWPSYPMREGREAIARIAEIIKYSQKN